MDGAKVDHDAVEQQIFRKTARELVSHRVVDLAVVADARFAEHAFAARHVRADGDTIAFLESGHAFSHSDDIAGDLMPDDLRHLDAAVSVVIDTDVRSANRARFDAHKHAVVRDFRRRHFLDNHFVIIFEHSSFHNVSPVLCSFLTCVRVDKDRDVFCGQSACLGYAGFISIMTLLKNSVRSRIIASASGHCSNVRRCVINGFTSSLPCSMERIDCFQSFSGRSL